MPGNAPSSFRLRTYKVGFGDCFLLTFHYGSGDRHVLIDFGSSGGEDDNPITPLSDIAGDIAEACGGKLHAVVATHRHKDHINGFATAKNGKGPGDVIARLKPDLVIQPWTEDPDAAEDATAPTRVSADHKAFTASLARMQSFCENLRAEMPALEKKLGRTVLRQLAFVGDTNIANRSAIENLQSMGRKNCYVSFGSACGLDAVLPGVNVRVLGPPTLQQSGAIRKQRSRDAAEYWHLQALAEGQAAAGGKALFPGARIFRGEPPTHARWFIERMQRMRGDQLLGIVRALDQAMNNTSVILGFECEGRRLLFPGDAQIENWSYALSRAGVCEWLKQVDLYKVGHHGSLNATPKSLWNLFANRSEEPSPNRLRTVCSTQAGKHGDSRNGTEVPRIKLVEALKKQSDYFTTENIKGRGRFYHDLTAGF